MLCSEVFADAQKGSFYHFFDSKEALMKAVLTDRRQGLGAFFGALPSDVPALESLALMYDAFAAAIVAQHAQDGHIRGCPIGSVGAEISTQSEAIRRAVCEALDDMTTTTRKLIERAIAEGDIRPTSTPKELAERLIAYVQGTTLLAKSRNDPEVMRELRSGCMLLLGVEPDRIQSLRSS